MISDLISVLWVERLEGHWLNDIVCRYGSVFQCLPISCHFNFTFLLPANITTLPHYHITTLPLDEQSLLDWRHLKGLLVAFYVAVWLKRLQSTIRIFMMHCHRDVLTKESYRTGFVCHMAPCNVRLHWRSSLIARLPRTFEVSMATGMKSTPEMISLYLNVLLASSVAAAKPWPSCCLLSSDSMRTCLGKWACSVPS